jgi:hypothetical protein
MLLVTATTTGSAAAAATRDVLLATFQTRNSVPRNQGGAK